MFKPNPLHLIDFYKADHKSQYPNGLEFVYSNLTPRSNKHFNWKQEGKGYVILWGLQGFCQEFLIDLWTEGFFKKDKEEAVKKFERRMKNAGVTVDGEHFSKLHDLGYLPIQVKALPEGSKVPVGVPVFTIENTHPEFAWLTNSLETALSAGLWKRITIATIAYEYYQICKSYLDLTCDNEDHLPFQCHDFSARGLGGIDWSANSGHLLFFQGTDTVSAIDYLEEYYFADSDEEFIAGSVPATEHSVMCLNGKETETGTVERLLVDVYPTGIVSMVMDTWDYFKFLTEGLPTLKDTIMGRDGKFVVRPDSGDPVKIICGYKVAAQDLDHFGKTGNVFKTDDKAWAEGKLKANRWALKNGSESFKYFGKYYETETGRELSEAEVKGSIEILWDIFGGTINEKGFKVLDEHIGLIYGDSITLDRADEILCRLKDKGFASSNVVFGVGSFTYQYMTRDTFGMAVKATFGVINGEEVEVFKDPATDDGTKKSAKGLLRVDLVDGKYVLKDQCTRDEADGGELKTLFLNGSLKGAEKLEEIRARALAL